MRIRARWRRLATEAAAEERQRLAREIHDGLAQELAFVSMQARQLACQSGDETIGHVADAAERALGESRELISALRSPGGRPLGPEIVETSERLAERHGATLEVDIDPRFRADPNTGAHLLRILREALSNSLVHGGAGVVTVQLLGGDRARLRIADDGIGFDPGAIRDGSHFGITSMRERAGEIDADLLLRSHPGTGTELEVVFP